MQTIGDKSRLESTQKRKGHFLTSSGCQSYSCTILVHAPHFESFDKTQDLDPKFFSTLICGLYPSRCCSVLHLSQHAIKIVSTMLRCMAMPTSSHSIHLAYNRTSNCCSSLTLIQYVRVQVCTDCDLSDQTCHWSNPNPINHYPFS